MKNIFIFGALIMGFMITSCNESAKIKADMMNDVDQYFADAENKLAQIDNAEDFVTFAEVMYDRSDLLDLLQEKYGDKDINDKDWEEIEKFIYDRATAYNNAEGQRCTEFLTPAIERYENIVNKLYEQYQAGIAFADKDLDEFLDAYSALSDFGVCENVDPALVDRLDPTFEKEDEIADLILEGLDRMYPSDEDEDQTSTQTTTQSPQQDSTPTHTNKLRRPIRAY